MILMYIYYTLYRLEDFENSCAAYEKCIQLTNGEDYLAMLNYAVTLYNNDEVEKSKIYYEKFQQCKCSLCIYVFVYYADRCSIYYGICVLYILYTLFYYILYTIYTILL